MTSPFHLATGFDEPDFEQWLVLAEKALKGGSLDRLIRKTDEGLDLRPLYTSKDCPDPSLLSGQAGVAPFIRGPELSRDPYLPWDIRQVVTDPEPAAANQVALRDLDRGVSSIEFKIDPRGQCGVVARSVVDCQRLIQGILTDVASVAVDAPDDPLGVAWALAEVVSEDRRATAKLAFNLDPLAARMTGQVGCSLASCAGFVAEVQGVFPLASCLRADARPIHEGGGTMAQELAVLIASGLEHVRAGEAMGLGPSVINQTLLFTLSIGPDVVLEMAKLRAARRLWGRVLDACGTKGAMRLQAVTSARMQTKRDPWTNIMRATCACFAGAVGGADIITVLPYTSALGLADETARRIARNTQVLLQEEAHVGRVTDPAGGAWAIEALADDLANAAWPLFQEIERAGGLEKALDHGLVQGWVEKARAARLQAIAKRKTALIGISVFANLEETLPQLPVQTDLPAPATPLKGAIEPMRLAADFEALRDRADQLSPTIFLATLGKLASFAARAGFARGVFEAGGIKALGVESAYQDHTALVDAFKASGASFVCLCGTDESYESQASMVAAALKAAGAKQVWLAGKFAGPGIDRNIFVGTDLIAELTHAIKMLEGEAGP
ncbi:methylmalonyl-CoA mutase subunit beta [Candidatus Phycosocius spiralis]|uniref:Methylmalonyl-CoA mutase n=1 Tax=Candidatus Phycosocius spiralis TaxID=2815099 RepID=A0ABQ4PWL9_9PROT|nr:methylmalonyl-CoA mutase subunit beta [Candidatus Phycosocius spiralis]GIU67470.1 methylmalonyl-CoA mutase [Candidatus Phycosocius spiralis]